MGDIASDAEAKLDVAYEHLLRKLDRQASILAELRTRAGIVLTASGIVAGLFGAEVLRDRFTHPVLWALVEAAGGLIALSALAGGLQACVDLLAPASDDPASGREWQTTVLTEKLVAWLNDAGVPNGDAMRLKIFDTLRPAAEMNWQTNKKRTERLRVACRWLGIQLAGWVLAFIAVIAR